MWNSVLLFHHDCYGCSQYYYYSAVEDEDDYFNFQLKSAIFQLKVLKTVYTVKQ